MTYNLTGVAGNTTSIVGYVQGVNEVLMFGWFGTLFLMGISILLILTFFTATNDIRRSLVAASYLSFGLAVLLKALDLIGNLALYISLIAVAIIVAVTWKKD